MFRFKAPLLAAGALCAVPSLANTWVTLQTASQEISVPLYKLGSTSVGTKGAVTFHLSDADITIEFVVMDRDPYISYGFSVTDFGEPSAFVFEFFTPIELSPGENVVNSSLVGGLNDVTGDGVSIGLNGQAFVQESLVGGSPSTPMGVDIGTAASYGAGIPGAHYAYGPFEVPPQPGPIGDWDELEVRVAFALSGNGDIFVATGYAGIFAPVPEPAGLPVLATGLLALVNRNCRLRRR